MANAFMNNFRKQYPEYDDIDDDVLVSALHKRVQPDVDLETFKQSIRYTGPQHPMAQRFAPTPVKTGQGYESYLAQYGVQNPDDPRHNYDYRAAYDAGAQPVLWDDLSDEDKMVDVQQAMSGQRTGQPMSEQEALQLYQGHYMWPDQFKTEGHPVPPERGRSDQVYGAPIEDYVEGPGIGIQKLTPEDALRVGGAAVATPFAMVGGGMAALGEAAAPGQEDDAEEMIADIAAGRAVPGDRRNITERLNAGNEMYEEVVGLPASMLVNNETQAAALQNIAEPFEVLFGQPADWVESNLAVATGNPEFARFFRNELEAASVALGPKVVKGIKGKAAKAAKTRAANVLKERVASDIDFQRSIPPQIEVLFAKEKELKAMSDVPKTLKNTIEAEDVGANVPNPENVLGLRRRSTEYAKKAEAFQEEGLYQEAMDAASQSQFFREAADVAEMKHGTDYMTGRNLKKEVEYRKALNKMPQLATREDAVKFGAFHADQSAVSAMKRRAIELDREAARLEAAARRNPSAAEAMIARKEKIDDTVSLYMNAVAAAEGRLSVWDIKPDVAGKFNSQYAARNALQGMEDKVFYSIAQTMPGEWSIVKRPSPKKFPRNLIKDEVGSVGPDVGGQAAAGGQSPLERLRAEYEAGRRPKTRKLFQEDKEAAARAGETGIRTMSAKRMDKRTRKQLDDFVETNSRTINDAYTKAQNGIELTPEEAQAYNAFKAQNFDQLGGYPKSEVNKMKNASMSADDIEELDAVANLAFVEALNNMQPTTNMAQRAAYVKQKIRGALINQINANKNLTLNRAQVENLMKEAKAAGKESPTILKEESLNRPAGTTTDFAIEDVLSRHNFDVTGPLVGEFNIGTNPEAVVVAKQLQQNKPVFRKVARDTLNEIVQDTLNPVEQLVFQERIMNPGLGGKATPRGELLKSLNERRVEMGKKPLSSQNAIKKMEAKILEKLQRDPDLYDAFTDLAEAKMPERFKLGSQSDAAREARAVGRSGIPRAGYGPDKRAYTLPQDAGKIPTSPQYAKRLQQEIDTFYQTGKKGPILQSRVLRGLVAAGFLSYLQKLLQQENNNV